MNAAASLACVLLFIRPALISSEEGESVTYMIITYTKIHIIITQAHVNPCSYMSCTVLIYIIFRYKGSWSEWTDCSATCGGGVRTRERICENEVECDSQDLEITQTQDCGTEECQLGI